MVDGTYQSKVYQKQGGDELVVASGGAITVESGGSLTVAGVTVDENTLAMDGLTASAAELNTLDGFTGDVDDLNGVVGLVPVEGVAAGYKIARGEATLDGTNPTPIVTGLATVVACTVTLKAAATPGDDPISFSVNYGGGVAAGTVNLYAYKTNGTDPTLVDSTNAAAVVSWIAVGT